MTVMKIALSMLGTIGLTAGTMLAVAEPTPEPLAAIPPSTCAKSACSKAACSTSTACGSSRCLTNAASCTAKAAVVGTPAPRQPTEPVAAGIANRNEKDGSASESCTASACEAAKERGDSCQVAASAKSSCEGKCGKIMVGSGVRSNSGVVGRVALVSATESLKEECCSKTQCEKQVTAERPAAPNASRRISIGLGLSNRGPIVRVSTDNGESDNSETCPTACKQPQESGCWSALPVAIIKACLTGRCEPGGRESRCETTSRVVATACDAKPACATPVCPTASEPPTLCSDCGECRCETCCCGADVTTCYDGPGCDGTQCLPTIQAGKKQPTACTPSDMRIFSDRRSCDRDSSVGLDFSFDAGIAGGHDDARANPPGFVHLSHVQMRPYYVRKDIQYFAPVPAPAMPSPRHWLFNADSYPSMATGAGLEHVATWPQLRTASFATPNADPIPPARPWHRHPVEGEWNRAIGNGTLSLTFEEGRIRGTWTDGGDEPAVRFSGTYSISEDGQIFGLIDDFSGLPPQFGSWVVDQPFAIRFRKDGDEIVLKDFRCAGLPPTIDLHGEKVAVGDIVQMFACGRFSRPE